jgi:uncharacterized repeat protein (TIGR01451 family)
MDQQKKKSKTVMTALLIVLGVLVLVLVGAIAYFYLIGDIFQSESDKDITCGCYYIDPQVVSTCGDTKRAFKFNTSTGSVEDCSASCLLSELSTNMLYSTTPQDSYLTCSTKNIPSTACNAMTIKTAQGLTVTGKVKPDEALTITATFDSTEYTNPQFLINNVATEPDETNASTITKTISDLGDYSTMQIAAQATDNKGDTVTSIICNRLIEVTTTARAGVSELTFDTYTSGEITKLKSGIINAGGLQEYVDTTLTFTIKDDTLKMTKGFNIDPERGRISLVEEDLYKASNFSTSNSFAVLNTQSGKIDITVEVIQGTNNLGNITTTVELIEPTSDTGKDGDDTTEDETPTTENEQPDTQSPTESQFSVTKASSETCVERVSPNNISTFTLTVRNNGDTTDTIESIKDKLPLGFEYVSGTSKLNNNAIADSVFVTITEVGNTQELVWEPQSSWSINAGGVLTITFDAIAGSNALSGENLNEIILTPSEIPADPSTLRASTEIVVAQDCTNVDTSTPATGIFDTTSGRILVGIAIILMGIIIYNTNRGTQLATSIVNSNTYRNAEMTSYKIFNPKKYFEEKILERRERER